jgi:hypothetical protein
MLNFTKKKVRSYKNCKEVRVNVQLAEENFQNLFI